MANSPRTPWIKIYETHLIIWEAIERYPGAAKIFIDYP